MLVLPYENKPRATVWQELDDVFGDDNVDDEEREILSSDFSHLPYMESALKETLRYFAPVPIIGREVRSGCGGEGGWAGNHHSDADWQLCLSQATADVTFPGGQVVPKGARVAIIPFMVHRNPRHYPDPLRFDPERFSPEQTRTRHHYAFIPFR